MSGPFKMKGFGGFGNSPMKAKTKTYSTEEDAPKEKRTMTSDIKTKKYTLSAGTNRKTGVTTYFKTDSDGNETKISESTYNSMKNQ